jgi:hypothetical protein
MKTLSKAFSVIAFFGGMAVLRADNPPTKPKLTNADVAVKAAGLRVQIEENNHQLQQLKAHAVRLKDVIKVNCVNDKLVQAKAEMNIADSANDSLQSAIQKNNDDDRAATFSQLETAATALKQLKEEAAACIGTPELLKQEAGNTVDRPDVPDDPLHSDPFGGYDGVGTMEPPAYPSPFR